MAHDKDMNLLHFPLPMSISLVEDAKFETCHARIVVCLLPFEFNWFEHVFVSVHVFTNVDFNVNCSKDIMQQLKSRILPSKIPYDCVLNVQVLE